MREDFDARAKILSVAAFGSFDAFRLRHRELISDARAQADSFDSAQQLA